MIIKRNLKSQMPRPKKRRKPSDSAAGEDDESSARKRRKADNGYIPLNLLREVAAGIIPISLHGLILSSVAAEKAFSASWCTDVPCSLEGDELKRNVMGSDAVGPGKAAVPRPPLVRTSRGRVQVLPSRFNDSVIENWRKDSTEIVECKKEKFSSFRTPKSCGQNEKKAKNAERNGFKCSGAGARVESLHCRCCLCHVLRILWK